MNQNNKPRVSGAIFENTSGRGPRFTGVIEIDGKKEQIAFWDKTSQAGKPYLQISEDRKKPTTPQNSPGGSRPEPRAPGGPAPRRPASPTPKDDDPDDTIPF